MLPPAIPEAIACDIHQAPFVPYTIDQKWTISLLKLLKDMNAPNYAFANILTWARAAKLDNCSFQPKGGHSHNQNLAIFTKALQNTKLLLPTVVFHAVEKKANPRQFLTIQSSRLQDILLRSVLHQ